MSWSKRLKHPMHIVKKGEEVEVQVLGIDPDERRISLGIKQLQENPWDTIGDRYFIGSKVQGKVRNLTDFGAFVEIEEGVDGLVHISDISWSKKIKHPKEVLKKGQEVEAVVTNIDTSDRRLSLSIKELTPSAWETFTNEHKPGDVVKGKISRFAGFGIFVELAPDLEGLCHISELSDERVENPEDLFEIGQELDFKILRIEHDVEKIGLSHRAVGKEGEPVMDSKSYSSQAKGGMASLGELANLRFGADKKEEAPAAEVPEETVEETAEAVAETETAESESPEVATDTDSTEAEAEVKAETETAAEEKTAETNETEDKGAEATEVETATSETTKEKADEVTESSEEPEESSETPAEEVVSDAPDAKAEETVSEDSPKSETETTVDTETAEEAVAETADAEEKVAETAEVEDAKEVVTETVEAEETEASTETEIAEETENAETGKEISAESSETVEEEKTKEKKAKS
jgi:predicted RNA-binding protein with RPS1 domain